MVYAAPALLQGLTAFHNNRRIAGVGSVPHEVYSASNFPNPGLAPIGFYAQFHMGS